MSQNLATQLQINPESKKDLLLVKQPNQPQVMQSFHVIHVALTFCLMCKLLEGLENSMTNG